MGTTDEQDRARGLSLAAPPRHASERPLLLAAVLGARTVVTMGVLLLLAALAPALFGMTVSTVMSDSMAPSLETGDAVVVRHMEASAVKVGDVVLVDDPDRAGRLRMHRLAERREGWLVLRGDANRVADSSAVAPQHVHGVAVLRVPLAGLPDYWLHTGAVVPLALLAGAMTGLAMLACVDIRPPPDGTPRPRRLAGLARLLPLRGRRALGMRAVVLLAALSAAVAGSTVDTHDHGWASFSDFATTNANTIGADNMFTNCPTRAANLPTPSLWYAYTRNSGTTITDLAGSNTGSLANATRVTGYCDGSAFTPYVNLTSSTATTAISTSAKVNSPSVAFSISLWMNPSNAGTGILADFTDANGFGSQTTTDRQIYYKTDGTLAFGARFGSSTGTPVTCSTPAPASGTWHHIAATATAGGVLTLYVDGVQACTVTGTTYAPGAAASGGFWGFGAEQALNAAAWGESTTTTGFVGGFDETTIYTSALTATDVSNLYAAGH